MSRARWNQDQVQTESVPETFDQDKDYVESTFGSRLNRIGNRSATRRTRTSNSVQEQFMMNQGQKNEDQDQDKD